MRAVNWLSCICAVGLTGCSLYPIPDDVISFSTEDIVRHARCEIRTAVINHIIEDLREKKQLVATADEIAKLVKATEGAAKLLEKNQDDALIRAHRETLPPTERDKPIKDRAQLAQQLRSAMTQEQRNKLKAGLAAKLPAEIAKMAKIAPTAKNLEALSHIATKIPPLASVAIVYTFDFNITETNKADGSAAFKLPFTTPKVFDLSANASVNLTRQGQRQFAAEDRWGDLITKADRCATGWPQHRSIVYPLDGSIGVGRVVETFINIADQGGAKDSFVDTLIFTTKVDAGANAAIKLEAVPHSFRLVSATAGLNGSRVDIHKMIISLAFPRRGRPDAITGVERFAGDLNAPFDRPNDWRARYNLCVMDARQREETHKMLRLEAPEIYCIKYADNFSPQYGDEKQQALTVTLQAQPVRGPQAGTLSDERGGFAPRVLVPVVPPDSAERRVRPNRF